MTNAEELNLSNLLDNLDKMEKCYESKTNDEEANRIRQYAIDALNDYYDTEKKICGLINKYRHLFKNPYIKGVYKGYNIDGTEVIISMHDYSDKTFNLKQGWFDIYTKGVMNCLEIIVDNIKGYWKRDGYCGQWESHITESKDWVASAIKVDGFKDNDLLDATFTAKDAKGNLHYTIENLKKYNWSVDGWNHIKSLANNTRKRTEELVRRFKANLEFRIDERTKSLSSLENESHSVYIKVSF